ncbi:hypothetical protein N7495_003060 [Penicillium taxi]|uniref:uncharacterized protein n=1 Tax=Penicillium taxi TaxID=168475 RepID=UPI00254534D7|nr:uncharacterized protein N7495_003060 [Penicillium taxi]KAJ5902532.1 hypothetical protein N7495_003060 [Penicillium taxi]
MDSALNIVYLLLGGISLILKQLIYWLFSLLYFLATPFLYCLQVFLSLAFLPVRLLIKFEPLIYFVTGAVLTGVTVGLLLHFTGGVLSQLLRIQSRKLLILKEVVPENSSLDWEFKWEDRLQQTTILEEESSEVSA